MFCVFILRVKCRNQKNTRWQMEQTCWTRRWIGTALRAVMTGRTNKDVGTIRSGWAKVTSATLATRVRQSTSGAIHSRWTTVTRSFILRSLVWEVGSNGTILGSEWRSPGSISSRHSDYGPEKNAPVCPCVSTALGMALRGFTLKATQSRPPPLKRTPLMLATTLGQLSYPIEALYLWTP